MPSWLKANKKTLLFVLMIALILPIIPAAAESEPIKLIVNGEQIDPDVPPQLVDNRTLVPVRWVSEALGADVTWDQSNNRVIIDSGVGAEVPSTPVTSTIQLVVDGEVLEADVPPLLINNRTMVPLRLIGEALGADVNWDQANRIVSIEAGSQQVEGGVLVPTRYDEEVFIADDELFIFIENHGQFEIPGLADKVLGNKLREAFPDMKIKLVIWDKPIRTSDLEEIGKAPDIYMITPEYIDLVLEKNGWQFDMTEMIENSSIDLDKMNEAAVAAIKSRSVGGMYGVPVYIRENVLFYNKDYFDHFDQPYPTNGMTYDEIYELTQKVIGAVGAKTVKGFTMHPDSYLMNNQLGLLPFEPTNSADPSLAEIKESVNLLTEDWHRLVENMYRFLILPGNNFVSTDDFFRHGNYAMAVTGINQLPQYLMEDDYTEERNREFYEEWIKNIQNIGVASVPILSEEENWTMQPTVMAAHITAQSDKKEQAMKVIEWLVSDEMQLHFSRNLLKAVIESDEVIEQFGADLPKVSQIEGLGEAVYWGQNAIVQNYENTGWPSSRFPLFFVFRQNILQLGYNPEMALEKAQNEDIPNWYGWDE